MKIFKLVTFLLVGFLFTQLNAQNNSEKPVVKEEKKIVIIKKTIDEDGNEVIEKIVKEGDEADNVFIIEGDGKEGKEIKVEVEALSDDILKSIKIIGDEGILETIDIDKIDVIKDLDESMIETIDVTKDGDNRRIRIEMKGDGENDFNFNWEGEGELPEDVKKELEERGIHLENHKDGAVWFGKMDDNEFIHEHGHENKAFLGVIIGQTKEVEIDNENGEETKTVEKSDNANILDIVEGSAAEEAGLQKDDVITAIDGKTINGYKDVVNVLGDYKPGDKITIDYTRGDQNQSTEATLKGREASNIKIMMDDEGNTFEFKKDFDFDFDFDTDGESNVFIIEDGDADHDTKIVTKKKVIIIKKDGEEVEVREEPAQPEMKNTLDLEEVLVFPNPTDGKLQVQFKGEAKPTTIRVTGINGKEFFKDELENFDGEYNKQINLENAPKGTLLMTITQGKKAFTEKIIVE